MTITQDTPGTVYVICFAGTPLAHAGHYTGWALDLDHRLMTHRNGSGSRLMAAVTAAGIWWEVAASWPGTIADEKKLKRRGTAKQWCPKCRPGYLKAKAAAQAARKAARDAAVLKEAA